ncbi:uncharacterized protein LOC142573945 isoform X1 [Dermacentor variabilis]|uniref:uncharacterized protein LOC142573945 isoform X1 n=1 Tax=Dermacentor variabilis TaxID=34621 RepID=UPI003F5C09A4
MTSRNWARGLALAFTVVMVLALGIQMLLMYIDAILKDANIRPSIWISWGFSSFLMAANIGFIITWMVAAATDNVRWMTICLTGLSVRLVGTVIYIFLCQVKAKLSEWTRSETAGNIMRRQTLFADVWLFPVGFMFAIECCFVAAMASYVESCKAAIDAKEEVEKPREKTDDSSSAGALAAGTSNN